MSPKAKYKRLAFLLCIHIAHVIHGYMLKEIADYLETHYTTVSKVMARDGMSEK
jgi:hypothetical protein